MDNTSDFVADTNDGSYGSYSINTSGVWTYTLDNANLAVQGLNEGQTLEDTFTVTTEDGTEQIITITITGTNDAAIISGKTTDTIDEGSTATLNGSLTSEDVDNNPTFIPANSMSDYGSYSIDENGLWTYTLDNENLTVQGLNDGQTLEDTFTVTTEDGTEQIITITITGTNDAPELTGSLANLPNGSQGTPYIVSKADLLQGYTDVDSDTLSIIHLSAGNGFEVIDNGNGTFTIKSPLNYNGPVNLTYQVSDGIAFTDASQAFSLSAVNHPPELTGVKATLKIGEEDVSYTVSAAELLQGYTDPEGDALSVVNLSAGNGFEVIDNGDGTFTVKPPSNFNGPVNLTYQVSDGAASINATQTFDLYPVNDAPVASGDTVTTDKNMVINGSLPAFTDAESDNVTYALAEGGDAANGILVINADGKYTYTPNEDFIGTDSFKFTIDDGKGGTNTYTININVVNMSSVTALSRREVANEGFEMNKKIEESFHLKAMNESHKDSHQIYNHLEAGLMSPYATHPQSGSAGEMFFAAKSHGLIKDATDIEKLNISKQNLILRNALTPPNPVTDSQGHIAYQIPEGIFKGGLGAIKFIASKKDGSPLPAWIKFDGKTGQLTAEVPKEMKAPLEIKVEAVDSRGFKAETTFKIYPRPNKMSFTGKHSLSSQFKNAFHLAA